ncbi:MAG: alpha-E domain-containing protein [Burkholderiaceae bacterium]|nr:alpha-E domain-containing protein [Burkholderiaceae bacterium]
MLSRTADHLYWMSRYTERAENTARMLDVNYQMSLFPQSTQTVENTWRALLDISELSDDYDSRHDALTPPGVMQFMVSDINNLSSIMRCFQAARENARAVRGAITTELWETINTTWLEAQRMLHTGMMQRSPAEFFEWVKFRSHLTRGVNNGTMMRGEVYDFIQLGTFLERADNTARLLDVKFLAAAASQDERLDAVDEFYYWAAILRSVSAFENYRKVYRDVITPERIAELLILRTNMPRSLVACLQEIVDTLARVRNIYSGNTHHAALSLLTTLRDQTIEEILAIGLHEYLTEFLSQINLVGTGISKDFLVPLSDTPEEGDLAS